MSTAAALPLTALMILTLLAWKLNRKDRVLGWIGLAYSVAWIIVWAIEPALWPIALLGFVQNIAFTFVSRGRNSGSLSYHLLASIFSNGIFATLLFYSIDMVAQAKSMPVPFLAVYTLATMSGSIFAHWLALCVERGKARSIQEDKFGALARRVAALEARQGRPYCEVLREFVIPQGLTIRVWYDLDDGEECTVGVIEEILADQTTFSMDSAEIARILCERAEANAVQVSDAKGRGYVYYREWP